MHQFVLYACLFLKDSLSAFGGLFSCKEKPMKSIQEIFNITIARGYYGAESDFRGASPFMCDALNTALDEGAITEEEHDYAIEAVNEYIKGSFSLRTCLIANNLPPEFKDRKKIYSDWENRPTLLWPDPYEEA